MTNLIADFAVRFNASAKRNVEFFFLPYSNLNLRVIELLLKQNCVNSFKLETQPGSSLLRIRVSPVYIASEPLIRKMVLVSKPGKRVYWTSAELSLQFTRNHFQGFYILSTSTGLCSSNELIFAKILEKPVSGEILLKIDL